MLEPFQREVAVIGAEGGALILFQAAEAVTPGSLERLERLSGAAPALSLTRRRSAALAQTSNPAMLGKICRPDVCR